jgi:hypothetical protein
MPAPAHGRLIWSGVFGTVAAPAEQWQMSIAFTDDGPELLEADLESIADAGVANWFQMSGGLAAPCRLTNVRAVAVSATGFTARDPFGKYLQVDAATDQPGGGGATLPHPTQVSLAVTLETGYPGPLGRGRFYLPCPTTGALDPDGTLTAATQTLFATRAQSLINEVNSDLAGLPGAPRLAVASGGSVAKGVAGAVRPIVSVRVGKRMDIQRRRAADIDEAYVVLPVA